MLSIMAEHHEQQPPSNEQKKDEGSYLLRERRYERLQRSKKAVDLAGRDRLGNVDGATGRKVEVGLSVAGALTR